MVTLVKATSRGIVKTLVAEEAVWRDDSLISIQLLQPTADSRLGLQILGPRGDIRPQTANGSVLSGGGEFTY